MNLHRPWQALKRHAKAVVVALLLLTVLTAGGIYFLLVSLIGGMSGTYPASDGDLLLTREARTALPAIDALRHYHDQHGAYPGNLNDLAVNLSSTSSGTTMQYINGWLYYPEPKSHGFVLSRRLGWDPSLIYRCNGVAGAWIFEPGDGTAEKPIVLHPEIVSGRF